MRKKPSQMAHQIPLKKPKHQNSPSQILALEPEQASPKSHRKDEESSRGGIASMEGQDSSAAGDDVADQEEINVCVAAEVEEDSGRERLKKLRLEVAGQVWIPDIWDQEELLQDWIDCSAFDASLFPSGIMSARSALVEEGRRENSGRLRIENRC